MMRWSQERRKEEDAAKIDEMASTHLFGHVSSPYTGVCKEMCKGDV